MAAAKARSDPPGGGSRVRRTCSAFARRSPSELQRARVQFSNWERGRRHDPAFRGCHQNQPDGHVWRGWLGLAHGGKRSKHQQHVCGVAMDGTAEHNFQDCSDLPALLHARRLRANDKRQWFAGLQRRWRWRRPVGNTRFRATPASMRLYEQCFASPCSSTAAFAYIKDFYAEVQDLVSPSVGASGELLDGGVISGIQTIKATVADSGGGARSVVVYVNGIRSKVDDFCARANRRVRVTQAMPGCFWPERSATRYRARSRMAQRLQRCTDLRV